MIEEYLEGPEISVLAFSDGYTIIPLPAAQDHKRIGEGDTGPNTGGMGAYAPAPVATAEITERIMKETLKPTIDGMRREGKSLHSVASCAFDRNLGDLGCQDADRSSLFRISFCWPALHWIHAD